MKNIILIGSLVLALASCNDSSEKTTQPVEATPVVQSTDTSSKIMTSAASNKDTVKKISIKQRVRTKKMRTGQKTTTSKKTSGNKTH